MNQEQMAGILANYKFHPFENFQFKAFGAGLIHGTYLIESGDSKFILQEFNNAVFQFPERISHNQRLVKSQGNDTFLPFQLPLPLLNSNNRLISTVDGRLFRLFEFVSGQTIQEITAPEQAYLAAKAYGVFAEWGKDVDTEQLQECIPDFHRLDLRFAKLQEVANEQGTLSQEDQEVLDFYLSQKDLIEAYQKFQAVLPARLTHNDTKINNLIFSHDLQKVEALVDLDTLMSGYLMYDFGDLVRTVACSEAETSRNWERIQLEIPVFEHLLKGYWEGVKTLTTAEESQSLLIAGEVMTCIMGLRFFTDHLQGNVYYKVEYPEQNFDRAKNQMILLQSLQASKLELEKIWKSVTQS
ncbi:aminoglycoside phosphotransferase family protein [Algoriphagus halophytocola]|uniref:Aminoglycoside phosphotransferase family protein n=1 Tax=Algoriphagus halophytocola TaxID=2991499 RepID=A0ABY6MEE8_9BACT|nr:MULTISPECIES: aminoglycoside phosphotransferase family protein [unclassified Algoriphagus]UZD21978.1 aminoglycoside phosphotransferase family protein [Algoriphagus sp. TR-M5]WBL43229.1 aminoglycoside phosphotransferase family protein [Algoriphagus sp. TR-M9]